MSKNAVLDLESYRLANYAVQVPCYICDGGNAFDAELCRHCFAPMAIAHQAAGQDVEPLLVATIGASGAGKTVYLGMLMDMLSRRPERLQLLARGAFSLTLQQLAVEALATCEFPTKTPSEPDRWNWVHCQVRGPKQRRAVELIMPDIAGEALLEEIEHPHSYPVIRSFLLKSSAILLLVDGARLHEGGRDQDYFVMKLLTYLSELGDKNGKKTGRDRPLALLLSKADQSEEAFEDPAGYAKRHASGLWQHCQERFPEHQFFATGVAGTCAFRNSMGEGRVRIPLRVEPRGIVEPFEWIIGRLKT